MIPMTESRLLRLDVTSACNFECAFCCWRGRRDRATLTRTLSPEAYRVIAEAAVRSGCQAMHLTGGEPLALGRNRVCAIVRAICGVSGLRHFYVTTNGSYLDDEYCRQLYEAGLRWLTVSVGAETDEKYRAWARPEDPRFGLEDVLSRIALAVRRGIAVRVHVPLTLIGVNTYEQLLRLLDRVEKIGVREVGFFRLNRTRDNVTVFSRIHEPGLHERVVRGFLDDPRWTSAERSGYRLFRSSAIDCDPLLPLLDVERRPHCRQEQADCGEHCQGTYSAYLRTPAKGSHFRACHREFDDGRNEFPIPSKILSAGDAVGLASILDQVWGWTQAAPAPPD